MSQKHKLNVSEPETVLSFSILILLYKLLSIHIRIDSNSDLQIGQIRKAVPHLVQQKRCLHDSYMVSIGISSKFFPHSSLFISLCNSQPSSMFSFGLSARFQWGFSWAFIDFWVTSNICTVAIMSINPLQLLFTNFSRLLSSTDDHILTNYSFSLGCSGVGTRGNGVSTPFHVLL